MKNVILKPRQTKFDFKTVELRRMYLERLLASVHNELIDDTLSQMDKTRFYNTLISGIKTIHEMAQDAKLEELDNRLRDLEEHYHKGGRYQ